MVSKRLARTARALVLVLLVLVPSLPPAQAGRSWDTLEADAGAAIHAVDIVDGVGFAVGDGGLVLKRSGDDWLPVPAVTDRDLYDVALTSKTHGLAVGADGVVLDYAHRWSDEAGLPEGVLVAHGTSMEADTTVRRVEWTVPRGHVGMGPGDTIGLGVDLGAGTDDRAFPVDFEVGEPDTAAAVVWDDLAFGSPAIDGVRDSAWNGAVYAEQVSGDLPYTLYLLRDHGHLHMMVETTAALDHLGWQMHERYGPHLGAYDLRLVREGSVGGSDTPVASHARRGAPTWEVDMPPGVAPGTGRLLALGFLDADTPILVGDNGRVLTEGATGYVLRTLSGSPTLRGVDVDASGRAYLVGSDAGGANGAGMWRYDDGSIDVVAVPPGDYGLHDIDLGACNAVGSEGTILSCNGSHDVWTRSTLGSSVTLHTIDQAPDGNYASGRSGTGGVLYQDSGSGWQSRSVPPGTGPARGFSYGLGGPVIATEAGQVLVLRPHEPEIVSMPSSTSVDEGSPGIIPVGTDDGDNDLVDITMSPPPDMLDFPSPPELFELEPGLFEIRFEPGFDDHGIFNIDLTITDGDFTIHNNTTVVIIDRNGPPAWDPHPDDTTPHSMPYTTFVHATDPDNDPLTLFDTVLPPGATFTDLGGGDGRIDWTPSLGDIGTHAVQLVADDGALTDVLDFDIIVPDDRPPVIDRIDGPRNVCADGPYHDGTATFRVYASDPDGKPLNFTWTFSDDNTTQYGNPVTHLYPTPGIYTVTVTVRDAVGFTDTATITVRVDDCVHTEIEPDRDCHTLFDAVSGTIWFYDHTGQGANGSYVATVTWNERLGSGYNTVRGTITNGAATYVLPFDIDQVPLNERGDHRLYVRATMPDSIHGDDERAVAVLDYQVFINCDFVKVP